MSGERDRGEEVNRRKGAFEIERPLAIVGSDFDKILFNRTHDRYIFHDGQSITVRQRQSLEET
jgi:hypothetical protein